MSTPAQQLRDRLITSANLPVMTAQTMLKMLNIIDGQQEEINNLRAAVQEQAERLEGKTAQLGRRISKLEGTHGA